MSSALYFPPPIMSTVCYTRQWIAPLDVQCVFFFSCPCIAFLAVLINFFFLDNPNLLIILRF